MEKKPTRLKKEHWKFLRHRATNNETDVEQELSKIIDNEIKKGEPSE